MLFIESSSGGAFKVFLILMLVVGGLVAIYAGFRRFRKAKLVRSTPESPVRDLKPGVVQVFGKVEGDDALISPLSGVPCFHYSANAQMLIKGKHAPPQWREMKKAMAQRAFYVNDGTGRVRVEPASAETIGLTEILRVQMGKTEGCSCTTDPSLGLAPPPERRLRGLLHADWTQPAVVGVGVPVPEHEEKKEKKGWIEEIEIGEVGIALEEKPLRFSMTEEGIVAGGYYSIIGTCRPDPVDGQVIAQGTVEKTFVISATRGRQFANKLRNRGLLFVASGVFMLLFGIFVMPKMQTAEASEPHEASEPQSASEQQRPETASTETPATAETTASATDSNSTAATTESTESTTEGETRTEGETTTTR